MHDNLITMPGRLLLIRTYKERVFGTFSREPKYGHEAPRWNSRGEGGRDERRETSFQLTSFVLPHDVCPIPPLNSVNKTLLVVLRRWLLY